MKLPHPKTRRPSDPFTNALKGMMAIPIPPDESDGSGRLVKYCRCVKRHGFSGSEAVKVVRAMLAKHPTPKDWTDEQILSRVGGAKVETGEAYEEDVPPWDRPAKPESNGHAAAAEEETEAVDLVLRGGMEVLAGEMLRVEEEVSDVLFDCGPDLPGFELGPGKITVVGSPPGSGKTSLASQACFAALANHPDLRLVIANAEMEPGVLVRREMSRLSGVAYQKLRFGRYSDLEKEAVQSAGASLTPCMKRTELMTPPYEMHRLIGALVEPCGLLVVDYLQKFRGHAGESVEEIEEVMNLCRWAAMGGWAVLAISSTSRQSGKGGKHDSGSLDMGAFRGSGEIEFQADAAYVLRDLSDGASGDRNMQLDCLKNRHGRRETLDLVFRVEQMRFESPVNNPAPHDLGEF